MKMGVNSPKSVSIHLKKAYIPCGCIMSDYISFFLPFLVPLNGSVEISIFYYYSTYVPSVIFIIIILVFFCIIVINIILIYLETSYQASCFACIKAVLVWRMTQIHVCMRILHLTVALPSCQIRRKNSKLTHTKEHKLFNIELMSIET